MLELEHQINNLKIQISNLPNGKLICSHNGARCKWYHSDGHIKTYIPKGNRKLAEDLALKKYYTCLLEDLEAEKKLYQLSLKTIPRKSEQLLINDSEIQNLLQSHFTPISSELSDWLHASFKSNPVHPDFTIRHPQTGEFYYWEHFGKMDDPKYAKNTLLKLNLYIENHIIPSINLITTYETQNHPLALKQIKTTISQYFS